MASLPQTFEPDFYRARHADLARMSAAAAYDHWRRYGRREGRVASPLASRKHLKAYLAGLPAVLELGSGGDRLAEGGHADRLDTPDAAAAGASWPAIVGNHAIERAPDPIGHLLAVERLLAPGGAYYLLVRDRRYGGGASLPDATVADLLDARHEGRRSHRLASVIEHLALTTHDDAARHWQGDAADPDATPREVRVRQALEVFHAADGDVRDVDAWRFTPASFAATIDLLERLDRSPLALARVFPTVRGGDAFVAVLRRRSELPAVTFLQTADADRYAAMLAVTRPNVAGYCRRHGYAYRDVLGVRRGFHPWQAAYNRIPMLLDLMHEGFDGWAVYVDADAYVCDMEFDLAGYLAGHADKAAILATSGVTGESWDINDGITLVNLGHPQGRRLIEAWSAAFGALSDDFLRAATDWVDDGNDQDLIQTILRTDPAIAETTLIVERDFLNSREARFIRQHLRAQTADLATRIAGIADEIDQLAREDAAVAADAAQGR